MIFVFVYFFFFFKQKTAYEMRISDWSSDVCSSDLATVDLLHQDGRAVDNIFAHHQSLLVEADRGNIGPADQINAISIDRLAVLREEYAGIDSAQHTNDRQSVLVKQNTHFVDRSRHAHHHSQIGRASCRERVCQYVV